MHIEAQEPKHRQHTVISYQGTNTSQKFKKGIVKARHKP